MNYEIDPALKRRAGQFLKTKSELVGHSYGHSGVKRALDILVSTASSPLTLSVISLAGLAIWLDDGYWPFVDVGNGRATGEHIPEWKLRTMIPNAQVHEVDILSGMSPPGFKRSGMVDPRITKVGSFLREKSLDEAPQMLNVMLGHLSAVGPRLPVESDWNVIYANQNSEPYRGFINLLQERLKFGVTGMYTVMGRDQLKDEDRYALEVMYWERQSFASDLRIIAATLPALRQARGK